MIDNLAIALSHALLALAVWRLAHSDAIDADPGTELAGKFGKRKLKDRLHSLPGTNEADHG
jgi:hypothetical protein